MHRLLHPAVAGGLPCLRALGRRSGGGARRLEGGRGGAQTDLAKIIGVNLRTLQNYELGVCLPKNPVTLDRIAAYFNVPVQSLVKSEDFYRMLASEQKEGGREKA